MFSVRQKREIAEAVQKVLRATDYPELPAHPQEINFLLRVWGAEPWSWAEIRNNPHNEMQDPATAPKN